MQEWKKNSIDYEYFYVQDISFDTFQSGVTYITNIERNYTYFLLKIYLPILIILLVSWSVFFINIRDLEARLTVSIVCLLSLIAYTFIIDQDLPKLSYLTIMDYIVLVSYFFSTLPTLESIFIRNIFNYNENLALKINKSFKNYTPIAYLVIFIFIIVLIIGDSPNTIAAFKIKS